MISSHSREGGKRKGKEERRKRKGEQAFVSISIEKERGKIGKIASGRDLAGKLGEPTWKEEGGPSFINF